MQHTVERTDLLRVTQDDDRGFSLIELMSVMAVLGVLAAIAVPVLVNQKDKASRAAATSDLRAVRTSQAMWLAEDNNGYTADLSDLAAMGYKQSDGVEPPVIRLTDDGYHACVRHRSMSDWLVFDSSTGATTRSATNACG